MLSLSIAVIGAAFTVIKSVGRGSSGGGGRIQKRWERCRRRGAGFWVEVDSVAKTPFLGAATAAARGGATTLLEHSGDDPFILVIIRNKSEIADNKHMNPNIIHNHML